MKIAWSAFVLLLAPCVMAQNPPDHDFYDLARRHASPGTRELWNMLENDEQESYDRAIKNRLEDQEDRIEELEKERD
jgi:hypothetical protein